WTVLAGRVVATADGFGVEAIFGDCCGAGPGERLVCVVEGAEFGREERGGLVATFDGAEENSTCTVRAGAFKASADPAVDCLNRRCGSSMSVCFCGYELCERSVFNLSLNGLSVFLTIFFDITVPFFFCGRRRAEVVPGRLRASNQRSLDPERSSIQS